MTPPGAGAASRRPQLSFDDLGTPVAEATMVVVDLETTGTDPAQDAITEIGAVKVRGGEVLGEFRTFVDPARPIPAYIARLTGISDETVRDAPRIDAVLPMFLEFSHDCALVAHNARFDVGFLRSQAAALEIPWPDPPVLDTLRLARLVYGRDEVRNHKLGTLAAHVGAAVTPDHRALSDARATVDVLHAIIERLGPDRAGTLEDLTGAHRRVRPAQLRARHLADTVPSAPGVYEFLDAHGAALYVGTSRNLRSRVRTYFTASETRRRVLDIIPRIAEIRPVVCETRLEAAVRELRIIAEAQPPANRHSLRPEKALWLRLGPGHEGLRAARLARDEDDGSAQIGPLASRHDVEPLRSLITDAVLGDGSRFSRTADDGSSSRRPRLERGAHDAMRTVMLEDPALVLTHTARRMRAFADRGRYEDAARIQHLAETFLTAARRAQRLRSLARCALLVAARRPEQADHRPGRWELVAIRHGRFAGTAISPPGVDPVRSAHALAVTGTGEAGLAAPLCQGYHQETELLLRWLDGPDMRVVMCEGEWSTPARARFDADALVDAYRRSAQDD